MSRRRTARRATVLALGASLGLMAACAAPRATGGLATGGSPGHSEAVRRALPTSVRVHVLAQGKLARTASGVCLLGDAGARRSFVLTNEHVVERGELPAAPSFAVVVEEPRGGSRELPARVVAQGSVPNEDLALLEVDGVALPAARLAEADSPEVGDDVVVVGAPFGRNLTVSSGLVSSLDWGGEGRGRQQVSLKTDAPIGYGTSGGGIFRVGDGQLLGVIEGYRTARVEFPVQRETYGFDVPMPGETFAAPAAKIRRFLFVHGLTAILEGRDPAKVATSR